MALVVASLPREALLTPWNPYVPVPFFVLLVFQCWLLATGDRRGLPGANTKPIPSTPSSLARRTSPTRVKPQNLMRVRNRVLFMRSDPSLPPATPTGPDTADH